MRTLCGTAANGEPRTRSPPVDWLLVLGDEDKLAHLNLALEFFLGDLFLADRCEEEFEVGEEIFVCDS